MNLKIMIGNIDTKKIYVPIIADNVKVVTDIGNCSGYMNFDVLKKGYDTDSNNENALNFREGNQVQFFVDDIPIFYGIVFSKHRDKSNIINVTAFDQLRYLKNKDTYVYENITASDLVNMICNDYKLIKGEIQNSPFIIRSCIEENTTLFDIIKNAIDITYKNTGQLYFIYDDFGKISFKNISDMKTNIKIDYNCIENFICETSIDNNTYNKVKLIYSDKRKKVMNVFVNENKKSIEKYGVLQYFSKIGEYDDGNIKSQVILNSYSEKTRTLSINNAIGNINVRAGSIVMVNLNVGDIIINDWLIVRKCIHKFSTDIHTMSLELIDSKEVLLY